MKTQMTGICVYSYSQKFETADVIGFTIIIELHIGAHQDSILELVAVHLDVLDDPGYQNVEFEDRWDWNNYERSMRAKLIL